MVLLYIKLFTAALAFDAGPLARHFHFAFGARGINFQLSVGRALAAETFISVPASVARIAHAAATAVKMPFCLLHSGGKRLVVRVTITRLREALSHVAGFAHHAPKYSSGAAKPTRCLATAKWHEFATPGVPAAFAVKLKLESGVRT